MRILRIIIVFVIILNGGCSLAPDYHQPFMPIADHFKETGTWVRSKKIDPKMILEPWWFVFNDKTLNELEARVAAANQDLKAAFARYQQAKAMVEVASGELFPNSQALFNASRQQSSVTVANPSNSPIYNNVLIGANLNYELDMWGRVRNTVLQSKNLAQASEADLAAATLSIQTQLATNYFYLRGADEAQKILDTTVIAYQKALYLTKKRHQGGAAPIADVEEARTQLEIAKTLAADMRLQRAQREHAIAVLIGIFPVDFSLTPAKLPRQTVKINPDLPSTLLERRPDIHAAELRVQAANANIGVARAAFFPDFNLSGVIGFQSSSFSNLLSKPSLFWSLGPISALSLVQPTASQTLFDGGRLLGLLKQANASYFETIANYRQIVLTAFQEVEDNLVAIKQLAQENRSQTSATVYAKRALFQAQNRYRGGIITFLEVVVIENTALQTELTCVNIRTKQLIANVQLIKALGGGW